MAVFTRVVDDGGFSAAARTLNLTPSAVSKLITRLEDRLGVRLLNRTTRNLGLTEEGEAYYRHSTRILADIEETEGAIMRLHAAPRGILRINSAVAFGNYQVAPLVPEFLARYPEIHLELDLSDSIVDLTEAGAHLGIRHGHLPQTSLVMRQIVKDRRLICAAPAYLERHGTPQKPADLVNHNCVMWIGSQRHLNHWPFDGGQKVAVKGNAEVNNGETLYRLAVAGVGLIRLAEFVAGQGIKAGRLVPVLTEFTRNDSLPIYAAYAHRNHLSPKVRALIDFLVEKFSPVPPWTTWERSA